MSQSSYSSVNHNRQLGIVREKVPKGAALLFLRNQKNSNGTLTPLTPLLSMSQPKETLLLQ